MQQRTFVVGDVHGHREELVGALGASGLIDADRSWSGGTSTLWFLGDFFDRGPDGTGVAELVMRLQQQASHHGGQVNALLGNHEILALGMHRFGETQVPSDFGARSFARSWRLNGGLDTDQERMSGELATWLAALPALARSGQHLLVHSDTIEYLGWGMTVDAINEGIAEVLAGDDIEAWWECWRRMTTRYAFRGPHGEEVATEVLKILGGERIVHGHSVIADQLGVTPEEVEAPYLYAHGKVLGVDGGVFVGGPCLVVELPYEPPL
ncbi:MAG: metallophosphoesterase [Sciscionella sp.]